MTKKLDNREKKKTRYDNFRELYAEFRDYRGVLERVQNGGMVQGLDRLLVDEISSNFKGDEEERDLIIRETLRNIGNPYVTSPLVEAGVKRTADAFKKFGEDNLEAIIRDTPEEKLTRVLQYIRPEETGSKTYNEIARLHKQVFNMERRLQLVKKEETDEKTKYTLYGNIRNEVSEYYASEYKDNPEMARFFQALINYQTSNDFASMKYRIILEKKKKEFSDKLKGNLVGYLKSSLKEKEQWFAVYQALFEEDYKRKENEQENEEE